MKRILFVDDDALVARIYREKLSEEGFEVSVAEDGLVAMKRLVEFKPDLVVLDLLMPKLNGADVLKFIRERPDLKSTRVIVFSNSFLAALVEQVGGLGVEGVLTKSSATPRRLIELIDKLLAPIAPAAATIPEAGREQSTGPSTKPHLSIIEETSSEAHPGQRKDEQFRTRVQEEFVKHLPRVLADIRGLSQNLLEALDPNSEMQLVEDLSRKVGFLTQMASMARCAELAQLSSALELLFFYLHERKTPVADSSRNTIAAAVALLTQYLEKFDPSLTMNLSSASVLVIDDDIVSNRGIVHALTHANLLAASFTDPGEALEKMRQTSYDLILLDVELPGMNGMALCEKIRDLDLHRKTPVIFITNYSDPKTRARSILSGGDDFISKPILPIELTVKVLTHLLKNRFDSSNL